MATTRVPGSRYPLWSCFAEGAPPLASKTATNLSASSVFTLASSTPTSARATETTARADAIVRVR